MSDQKKPSSPLAFTGIVSRTGMIPTEGKIPSEVRPSSQRAAKSPARHQLKQDASIRIQPSAYESPSRRKDAKDLLTAPPALPIGAPSKVYEP